MKLCFSTTTQRNSQLLERFCSQIRLYEFRYKYIFYKCQVKKILHFLQFYHQSFIKSYFFLSENGLEMKKNAMNLQAVLSHILLSPSFCCCDVHCAVSPSFHPSCWMFLGCFSGEIFPPPLMNKLVQACVYFSGDDAQVTPQPSHK